MKVTEKKKLEMPKFLAKETMPQTKGCNGCDREIAGCRAGGLGRQRQTQ